MSNNNLFKAEILLTQECNLKCSYCHITRNPCKDSTTAQWKAWFKKLQDVGLNFAVLYGGEAMIREDIEELIDYLNEIKLDYTIITSGYVNMKKMRKVMAKLRGFTVSIDEPKHLFSLTPLDDSPEIGEGSHLKSQRGWLLIDEATRMGIKDWTVCITVHRQNLKYIKQIAEELFDMGVWVITTLLHHSDDSRFSYRATTEELEDLILTDNDRNELKELGQWFIDKFYEGKTVHNIPAYYELWGKSESIKLDWHCKGFQCLSIMPDGTLRPCLDGQSGKFQSWNIDSFCDEVEHLGMDGINEIVAEDVKGCSCFWDPKWMSQWLLEDPKRAEFGNALFDHNTSPEERVKLYKSITAVDEKPKFVSKSKFKQSKEK